MERSDIVLAAMAGAGWTFFTAAQMQKLLFLIDETIPEHIGGKRFDFVPYDYGPFDKNVYRELESLQAGGYAWIHASGKSRFKTYSLSGTGMQHGLTVLQSSFAPEISEYIQRLSKWVASLSFAELVSAIYRDYPHMRVNSVFRAEAEQ